MKFIILILAIILLNACKSNPKVNTPKVNNSKHVVENLPAWYFTPPKDKNKIFGTGKGISTSDAVDNALLDAISSVVINVDTKVSQKTVSTRNNNNTSTHQTFISKSIQEVKKTFTSEYTIEKIKKIDHKKFILLSLEKKDLIKVVLLTIKKEKNDLSNFNYKNIKNESILNRIDKIKKAEIHSKKIDYLVLMLNALNYNYSYKSKTSKYEDLLKKESNKLTISINQNNIPRKYFIDMRDKIYKHLNSYAQKHIGIQTPMSIKLDDVKPKEFRFFKNIYSHTLTISNDGRYALSDHYGILVYLDLQSGDVVFKTKKFSSKGGDHISQIAISKNGKFALTVRTNNTIGYYDLKKHKLLKVIKNGSKNVCCVAISNNNFALSASKNSIRYWNLKTGKTIFTLKGHSGCIKKVAFLQKHRYAISLGSDKTIKYWDLKTGKLLKTFKNQYISYYSNTPFAISSDDTKVLSKSSDEKSFYYIDLKSKKILKKIKLDKDVNLKNISFSKDGKYAILLAYNNGGRIMYYNLASGKKRLVVMGKYKGDFAGETSAMADNGSFLLESYKYTRGGGDNYLRWRKWNLSDKDIEFILNAKVPSNKRDNVIIRIDSCSEAYRAIRGNKKFWQSAGVDVYKGCINFVVTDGDYYEYYSKRIEGSKIKDYETLEEASFKSFNNAKSQRAISNVFNDLSNHELIKQIMK